MLEREWRGWMAMGGLDTPKNPDSVFLGFCRKWYDGARTQAIDVAVGEGTETAIARKPP